MKRIMFNDYFGLTADVLSGSKTQTRRVVPQKFIDDYYEWREGVDVLSMPQCVPYKIETLQQDLLRRSKYEVGEAVAVAQSYKNAGYDPDMLQTATINGNVGDYPISNLPGWNNKMFTYPAMMPYRIIVTDVRVERLQDISDDDCLKEGVVKVVHRIPTKAPQYHTFYYPCQMLNDCADKVGWGRVYDTPQKAYAELIDRASGKKVWEANPWVWVYDFEVTKI